MHAGLIYAQGPLLPDALFKTYRMHLLFNETDVFVFVLCFRRAFIAIFLNSILLSKQVTVKRTESGIKI